MAFNTILPVGELLDIIERHESVLIFDCEFDLADSAKGEAVYREGHIPGALYLHLDQDLSGKPDGTNGRHPLPDREIFATRMRASGLRSGLQVVAYDGNGGHFAARLWWMLRWLGHDAVAVLDGGRQAWIDAGLPLEAGKGRTVRRGDFAPTAPTVGNVVTAGEVLANLGGGDLLVVDARDAARFNGSPHPLDTVSGHIPGAVNRFYRQNFDGAGAFRPAEDLHAEFVQLLGGTAPEDAVMQCGSGVTACVNLLAMEIAGLGGSRLYPGSWSEWTADPSRPIAGSRGVTVRSGDPLVQRG